MIRSLRSTTTHCAALVIGAALLAAGTAVSAQTARPAGESSAEEPFASRQGQPMSDDERRLRAALLQRSTGFGGIFGPLIAPLNRPSAARPSAPAQKSCGAYSDYAACQAYRNGDRWAADRLQNKRSTGAERDWYNR
jgi:hypothetical protein